jgi:predicted O-methyltransferase YrrM
VVDTFNSPLGQEQGEYRRPSFEANMGELLRNLTIWEMDSRELRPRLKAGRVTLDLALIDGDHSYAMAKNDLDAVLENCRAGATVFIHDIFRNYGVMRAAGELLEKNAIEVVGAVDSLLIVRVMGHGKGS